MFVICNRGFYTSILIVSSNRRFSVNLIYHLFLTGGFRLYDSIDKHYVLDTLTLTLTLTGGSCPSRLTDPIPYPHLLSLHLEPAVSCLDFGSYVLYCGPCLDFGPYVLDCGPQFCLVKKKKIYLYIEIV